VPTWLYRVALNTAIAWTRKETRHKRGKRPLADVELTTASPDGYDPRVEWLYRQIAQLKDVDRSVALLMLDGFSYREIAAIVGITESNVGVKVNRIKSALVGKRAEEQAPADGSLPMSAAELSLLSRSGEGSGYRPCGMIGAAGGVFFGLCPARTGAPDGKDVSSSGIAAEFPEAIGLVATSRANLAIASS
jgi:hypothetical protein